MRSFVAPRIVHPEYLLLVVGGIRLVLSLDGIRFCCSVQVTAWLAQLYFFVVAIYACVAWPTLLADVL